MIDKSQAKSPEASVAWVHFCIVPNIDTNLEHRRVHVALLVKPEAPPKYIANDSVGNFDEGVSPKSFSFCASAHHRACDLPWLL